MDHEALTGTLFPPGSEAARIARRLFEEAQSLFPGLARSRPRPAEEPLALVQELSCSCVAIDEPIELWVDATDAAEALAEAGERTRAGARLTANCFRKRIESPRRRRLGRDAYAVLASRRDPSTGLYPMSAVEHVGLEVARQRGVEVRFMLKTYRQIRKRKDFERRGLAAAAAELDGQKRVALVEARSP